MLANLLSVAGVNHVITIDLHASQMQGFFKCPIDNLVAEPLIAKWIKRNVNDWQEAVVVSKNPGGTKRVTSLADAMKLSFGIVTTDKRLSSHRGQAPSSLIDSMVFDRMMNGLDKHQNEHIKSRANEDSMTPAETPDSPDSELATPNGVIPSSPVIRDPRALTPRPTAVTTDRSEFFPLATVASEVDTRGIDFRDLRRSRTEPADLAEVEEEFTDEVPYPEPFSFSRTSVVLTEISVPETLPLAV